MAKARRTTHRSSKGTKLYGVRDPSGQFKDIQTYKRAHRADLAKTSKVEKTAGRRPVRRRRARPRRALSARLKRPPGMGMAQFPTCSATPPKAGRPNEARAKESHRAKTRHDPQRAHRRGVISQSAS